MTSTLPKGTLGSVASLLAATLYQGNPDRNHKLCNIVSSERCMLHMQVLKSASYLNLQLEIDDEGRLGRKHYDKRDDFNLPIVNFPFVYGNIPAAPAYGAYISQMIRYYRACGSYQDFLDRELLLTMKLLNQEFQKDRVSFISFLLRSPCINKGTSRREDEHSLYP
jgi:hypothetical protein